MLKFPSIITRLTPGQIDDLKSQDLTASGCVVFDVLRATTTMNVALDQGVEAIYPVGSIEAAVELRRSHPDLSLAGERGGVKIEFTDAQGVDWTFDYGNSPREFENSQHVGGQRLIMTTTNGTRALEACRNAACGSVGCLLNRSALLDSILGKTEDLEEVFFLSAGTGEEVAIEDVIGIGATLDLWLKKLYPPIRATFLKEWDDASRIAHATFLATENQLPKTLKTSLNGSRLMKIRELAADVDFCSKLDTLNAVGVFDSKSAGWISLA